MVREAKSRGLRVTAEACPHHFTLTEEVVRGFNTLAKMNPPLRTWEDVQAIKEGLRDGTIDVIATDHAPHATQEKQQGFTEAPFGIVGLETALSLTLALVEEGILSLESAVEKVECGAGQSIQPGERDVGDRERMPMSSSSTRRNSGKSIRANFARRVGIRRSRVGKSKDSS